MGVIFFGGQLWGVQLGGPQYLQHALQSLGHRHRAALLSCVDDIYDLWKEGRKEGNKTVPPLLCDGFELVMTAATRQKQPRIQTHAQRGLRETCRYRFMCRYGACESDAEEIFSGAAVGCAARQCDIQYTVC